VNWLIHESFNYSILSKEFGICVDAKFSESEKLPLKDIQYKCILLHINNNHYVISLLHIIYNTDVIRYIFSTHTYIATYSLLYYISQIILIVTYSCKKCYRIIS